VRDIVGDAQDYKDHCGKNKSKIDVDDLHLAIQSNLEHTFTHPPPREVTSGGAEVNRSR